MADVFISYAREDGERASKVAHALQAAGMDVFWDSEIPPGQTWADYIEGKLANCKAVIVLWSENSTRSQWVREEARMGRDKGKLIPAMLDNSPAPFGFGEVQAANLSTWNGEDNHPDWQRMMAAVRAVTSGASPAAAAAAAAQPVMSPPPSASVTKTVSATWNTPDPSKPPGAAKPWWRTPWAMAGGGVVALLLVLGVIGAVAGGGGAKPDAPMDTAQPVQQPAQAAQPVPQGQDYQAILQGQLQQVNQLAAQEGFQLVGQPYMNGLAQGGEQAVPVELHTGYEYRIVAVCDRDCTDIDLRLFDENNVEVATDVAVDDNPIVQVSPRWTGAFSLKVVMASCSVAPCYFAAQLYGRAARPQ
ncbi:MAG: toll/interleukin-1 receptor domain-containing protein [Caulobacterales bacterium]